MNLDLDEQASAIRQALAEKFERDNQDGSVFDATGSGNLVHFSEAKSKENTQEPLHNLEERLEQQDQKSINNGYKFMSIDQLGIFKQQFIKGVNQIVMRMHKSTFAVYCLYPEFNKFEQVSVSIFDKVYLLQMVEHTFSQFNMHDLSSWQRLGMPKLMDFELEA